MSEARVMNFMGLRKVWAAVSIAMVLASVVSLAVRGLNFGLDFTGGTSVELRYATPPSLPDVRELLKNAGYASAVVTNFGTDRDVSIRIQTQDPDLGTKLVAVLSAETNSIELQRVSYVGPQIGEELRDDGGLGLLFALAVVMCYVAVRFQFKFSVSGVVALAHDVIITLGMFSILQLDFDLTVLAALLAVIGYSLNDTIVVYDRIRENFRKMRDIAPIDVINASLSQTLDRTLMTSGTTLLVLLALFFVGGEVIHNFSVALIMGIVIGTYSSIYIAANILLTMNVSPQDLMEVEKEGLDQEDMLP